MKFSTSLALAAAASTASAHTIFLSLNGGAVGDGVRVPSYDGVSLSFHAHLNSLLPQVLFLSFPPSCDLPFISKPKTDNPLAHHGSDLQRHRLQRRPQPHNRNLKSHHRRRRLPGQANMAPHPHLWSQRHHRLVAQRTRHGLPEESVQRCD